MNTRIAIPLILLLTTTTAGAHQSLAEARKQFCRSTETPTRQYFYFDTYALLDYATCFFPDPNSPTNCTGSVPTSTLCSVTDCGDFDDDFGIAKRMALNYCVAASPNPNALNADGVKLILTSSSNFSGPNHHTAYQFEEGLGGYCLYCTPAGSRTPGE